MTDQAPAVVAPRDAVVLFGDKYGIQPSNVFDVLKQQTRFATFSPPQLLTVVALSMEHGLNPMLGHICFFKTKSGISHYVEVDGRMFFLNSQREYDGHDFTENPAPEDQKDWFLEFLEAETLVKNPEAVPWSVTCTMHRKDRNRPIVRTEKFIECYRPTYGRQSSEDWKAKKARTRDEAIPGPWDTNPTRMLEHKATHQAARAAFSLALPDRDEAYEAAGPLQTPAYEWTEDPQAGTKGLKDDLEKRPVGPQEGSDVRAGHAGPDGGHDDLVGSREAPGGQEEVGAEEAPLEVDPATGEVIPSEEEIRRSRGPGVEGGASLFE